MKRMIAKIFKGLLPLAAVLALGACGGGGGDATGQLEVGLTDAAADYQEVVVTIKEIHAVPASGENSENWPVIPTSGDPINVLDFQFQQEILGDAIVPAGEYKELRLILAGNEKGKDPVNFVKEDGAIIPINTPSADTTGLKIKGDFTVEPGQSTAILLDFDPNWAINQNYSFNPTGIRLVRTKDLPEAFGALIGIVKNSESQEPLAEATVSAVTGEGAIAATTQVISDPTLNIGTYRLFLPPGKFYDLRVNAPGFEEFTTDAPYEVIEGADVTADIELIPVAEEQTPVAAEEPPTAE